MPEDRLPIGGIVFSCCGAVRCNDFAEADTKEAGNIRDTKCPDSEVIGSRIDLDNDW